MKRLLLSVLALIAFSSAAHALPKVNTILDKLDELQSLKSDMTAQVEMVQQKKDQGTKQYQMVFYRRDADDSFLMVFTAPDSEKGNGYLKEGDNMWMYRQNTRTFQHINRDESISGSDMKAGDVEKRKTKEQYGPALDENGKEKISQEMLGKIPVYKFEVAAKVKDVTYPKVIYWVRTDNFLPLKVENYSLSGTLMQTAYFLKYTTVDGRYISIQNMFIDEFEVGNKTVMKINGVSFSPISKSVFTKGYLESLSK